MWKVNKLTLFGIVTLLTIIVVLLWSGSCPSCQKKANRPGQFQEAYQNYQNHSPIKPKHTRSISLVILRPTQAKSFFIENVWAKKYLGAIDPRVISEKLADPKRQHYWKYIEKVSGDEKSYLNKNLRQLPINPLLTGTWKIAKTNSDLEFGMPFTLGDVIFFSRLNDDQTRFRRVLVHERIHVLQRKWPEKFNHFLQRKFNFRLVARRGKLPFTVFENPDGLQLPEASWILPTNGPRTHTQKQSLEWFCPFLVLKAPGDLERRAVKVTFSGPNTVVIGHETRPVKSILGDRFPSCPEHQLYHPYEIMAEMGMMYLMDGTSGDEEIDNFYRDLSLLTSG